jgi:signal transduction histidine kinase
MRGRRLTWRAAGPGWSASDRALDRLAARYVSALRLGSAIVYAIVGPLAAGPGVSSSWLAFDLAILGCWSALFVIMVARHGMRPAVIAADALIILALLSTQRQVVPASLIANGTTWMLPLASTSVFILQLAWRPLWSVPAAGIIGLSYFGSVLHPIGGWYLFLQAVTTALLMVLVRRAGRAANAVIDSGLRADWLRRAEAVRLADDREVNRQLHDTILSTLAMVASGAFTEPSATLREQADRDLEVLRGLRGNAPAPRPAAPLGERIREVISESPLLVMTDFDAATVPAEVSERLARSVAEALRNVSRHAGTGQAEVSLRGGDGWARIEVADRGRGFDPSVVPLVLRGVRESIAGRMEEAGGSVTVISEPGRGTNVVLRWPA